MATLLLSGDDSMSHFKTVLWNHTWWRHQMETFPRYWPFVRESVDFPHRGQWRRALMYSLICARANGWVNNRDAVDKRRHHAHYDVTVMDQNLVIILCVAILIAMIQWDHLSLDQIIIFKQQELCVFHKICIMGSKTFYFIVFLHQLPSTF